MIEMNKNTPCEGPAELAQANCGSGTWPGEGPAVTVPPGQAYRMEPVPEGEPGDFGPAEGPPAVWEPGYGRHRKPRQPGLWARWVAAYRGGGF